MIFSSLMHIYLSSFFYQSIEKHVATNWLHCKFEYLYAIL